ncbi:unnamed protein product, partial [Lymnaea stagnalis]
DDRSLKPNSADGLDTDGLVGQRLSNDSTECEHRAEQRSSGLSHHTSGLGDPSASNQSNEARCTKCAHTRTIHPKISTVQPLLNISGSRSQSQTTEQSHTLSTSTHSRQGQTFSQCTQDATSNHVPTTTPGSTSASLHVQSNPSTTLSSTQTLQSMPHNRVSSPAYNAPLNASTTDNLGHIPTSASLNISNTAVIPKSSQPSAASDDRKVGPNPSTTTSTTTSAMTSATTSATTFTNQKNGATPTSSAPHTTTNERKKG